MGWLTGVRFSLGRGRRVLLNVLSFIAVIALTITVLEGIFILLIDRRSRDNRLFFMICVSISVWLIGGAFGYSAHTREEAFFWLRVASPGFIFMHAFVLHFTLGYTGRVSGPWTYLLYLPSCAFLYLGLFDTLVFSDIYRSGAYWVMVPDYNAPSFYLFILNYLSYYCAVLVLLVLHMRRTVSVRIRSQSRIIFVAIAVTIASYNIEPFLAPLIFDYHTYGQAPLYSIVWVTLIWHAMTRYRFLGVYERLIAVDVINALGEMVAIIDNGKRVIRINRALRDRLGGPSDGLLTKDIFIEHEMLDRLMNSAAETPASNIALNLAVPDGRPVLVNATLSVFRDRFGDAVGYILTAQEPPDGYALLKSRGITEREYHLVQLVLAGNSNGKISRNLGISLRTVETHITHIFGKLGLSNRGELVNYCTDYFSGPSGS